ncbi:MAG: hypothetical protein WB392_00445 [Methanotrichaceae archaeon]
MLVDIQAEVITRSISSKDIEQDDAFDFLVTENRDFHKKAGLKNVSDKVLLVDEALQIFDSYINKDSEIAPPPLKSELVRNLNYDDPIFDTLKEEYKPEFGDWFKKISEQGRKSWVYYRKDGSIGALLIHKLEDERIDDSIPPLPKKKRLKISTLKVTHIGYKIGELFIKMVVDISIKNNIDEIYLTHFTKPNDPLVELISEYGFIKAGVKNNGEDIFVKRLSLDQAEAKSLSPIDISKIFYPSFYDGDRVKKFIVPIVPKYHEKLFTDFPRRQTTLPEYNYEFVVEGNTIKKAYLSHSNIKRIGPGDLLLFYRSEDKQAITSIGVVEAIYTGVEESGRILQLVGKRTVFSHEEIEEWVRKSPVSIFLFRHHFHLERPVGLKELIGAHLLKAAPESAMEISNEIYAEIKKLGGINERFTVH